MSIQKSPLLASVVALFLVVASLPAWSANKKVSANMVDSGTFGVYVNGKRVASEKFEISQNAGMSLVKAELKLEGSSNPQYAELQLAANGDLQHYQWSEKDQGTAIVEPKDEFLIEHVTLSQNSKKAEQPFMLPTSTLILDDYFFSQRQLLLWRYLATQCTPSPDNKGCQLTPSQFGVIVPRQQTSTQVTVQYTGQQKVAIKGTDQDLSRFEIHSEGSDWIVWMDQGYKIQKIAIEAEHTEIYRD